MTHYLIDNQPEEWDQLAAIYDKSGEYKQAYIESKMNNDQAAEANDAADENNDEPNESINDENKQD